MTLKFGKPAALRPPPVCKKMPPWPSDLRRPVGILLLTYSFRVVAPWLDWPAGAWHREQGSIKLYPFTDEPENDYWLSETPRIEPFGTYQFNAETQTEAATVGQNFVLGYGMTFETESLPIADALIWKMFALGRGNQEEIYGETYAKITVRFA
jgi:hypothetical protein